MAAAANASVKFTDSTSSMPHIKSTRTDEVPADIGTNHLEDKGDTRHQQSARRKNRVKKKQGRRKDKAEENVSHSKCSRELNQDQRQDSEHCVEKNSAVSEANSIASSCCQSDFHPRHLNSESQNHVTQPLQAITHLVERLGIEDTQTCARDAPLPGGLGSTPLPGGLSASPLPGASDVPPTSTIQGGGIDEALAVAKCNSEDEDDDDDDADLELPSSLSDFVLGYHDECHYAVTRLPPNDDDIDTIALDDSSDCIRLVPYESELQMPDIIRLITKDLSEPYSIYTYRYFIHNWPHLCFLAMSGDMCVGAIVCKLDVHKKMVRRGYIAMLAVDEAYRKKKLGSSLVKKAIRAMVRGECDEVVLETEITNKPALRLYENLGFVRDKRLFRYYLNGVDALRLKLWLQ